MEAKSISIVWYQEMTLGKPALTIIVQGDGSEDIHTLVDLMQPNNRPAIYSKGKLYGSPESIKGLSKVEENAQEAKEIVQKAFREPTVPEIFEEEKKKLMEENIGKHSSPLLEHPEKELSEKGVLLPTRRNWVEDLALDSWHGWAAWAVGIGLVAGIGIKLFS